MSLTVPQEIPSTIRSLAERVGPAVVGVNGRGSGIVVAKGLVVTNAHNLGGPGTQITFGDGRHIAATLTGADLDGDIAVLSVDTDNVVPFEDAVGDAELGDFVFGLSRPGGRALRVTTGNVSSLGRAFRGPRGRRISGGVEHTAPLPRGSSGGPVVDADGRLVGINTHRVEDGFYLALPADSEFRRFVERAAAGEVVKRPSLGVAVVPPHAARRMRSAVGLPPIEAPLIRAVDENGPAGRAGLRRGDLLIKADDVAIASVDDLHRALDAAGDSIALRVVRGAEEIDVLIEFDAGGGSGGEA